MTDLTGQKFNKLTALSFIEMVNDGHAKWLYRCDCGKEIIQLATRVKHNYVKSCGCDRPIRQTTKARDIKYLYGITLEAYEKLKKTQSNRCAICGVTPDKCLDIDHCHQTGTVRGLLCQKCNKGLGFFEDSIDLLSCAIKYLKPSLFKRILEYIKC